MAERDPQFEQDVLRILYAALSDRAALAAAMSGQQPMPVANATPGPTDPSAPSRPSPFEVGVQGGALVPVPKPTPLRCIDIVHVNYQDIAFPQVTEDQIKALQAPGKTSREEVVQEAMRRVLAREIDNMSNA